MAQKKSQPSKDKTEEDKSAKKKSVSIQILKEMPPLVLMEEGVFYISHEGTPQARLKAEGKIIKFKLEV